MKKISILLLISLGLFAANEPLHIDLNIYTNKSFLNKTYKLKQSGEINTKVPSYITLKDIKYEIDKQCKIDNSSLSNILEETNSDLKELRAKKDKLINNMEILTVKNSLLKTFSLEKIDNFSKIDKISTYLTKNLVKNLSSITKLKKEIEEIDKKIKEKKWIKEKYKRLKISFTCKTKNYKLTLSYPQKNIKYTPFYNINANIHNKSLTIERKATLFYSGIENYNNINLNIYSYKYNQNVAPTHFYPIYLGGKREIMYAKSSIAMDNVPNENINNLETKFQELPTMSSFKIKNAKLKSGEKNLLNIDKEILNASFKTVIDAYGTNKAYLEASVKTKKDYNSAQTNYFLNQNPIASRYIKKIKKETITKLYFGENEHIQIKKELIKRLNKKTFFGDKEVSTKNWKFTIENKKDEATQISFIQRIPLSKDANIEIKAIEKPKANLKKPNGMIIWNFLLEANDTKKIIFGYEISNQK